MDLNTCGIDDIKEYVSTPMGRDLLLDWIQRDFVEMAISFVNLANKIEDEKERKEQLGYFFQKWTFSLLCVVGPNGFKSARSSLEASVGNIEFE